MGLRFKSSVIGANGSLAYNKVIVFYSAVLDDATGELTAEYVYPDPPANNGSGTPPKRPRPSLKPRQQVMTIEEDAQTEQVIEDFFVAYNYGANSNGEIVPILYKTKLYETNNNGTSLDYSSPSQYKTEVDLVEPYYYIGVEELYTNNSDNPEEKASYDVWEKRSYGDSGLASSKVRMYTNRVVVDTLQEEHGMSILPPIIDQTETAFIHNSEFMRIAFYFQECDATTLQWYNPRQVIAKIEINQQNALICDDYVILDCQRADNTQDSLHAKYYCDIPLKAFKDDFKLDKNKNILKLNLEISVALALIKRDPESIFQEPTWDNIENTHRSLYYWFEKYTEKHSVFGLPVLLYPIAQPRLTLQYLFSSDEGSRHPKTLKIDLQTGLWGDHKQIATLELDGRPGNLLLEGALSFDYAEETDTLSDYTVTLTNNALWDAQILEQKNVKGYSKITDSIITESTYRNAFSYTYQYNFFKEAQNGDKDYLLYLTFNTVKGCPCILQIQLKIKGFDTSNDIIEAVSLHTVQQHIIAQEFLTPYGLLISALQQPEFVVVTDDKDQSNTAYWAMKNLVLYTYTYHSIYGLGLITKDLETNQLNQEKYFYRGREIIEQNEYDKWVKQEINNPIYTLDSKEQFILYTKPIVTTLYEAVNEDTSQGPTAISQDSAIIITGAFTTKEKCSKYKIQCLRKPAGTDEAWQSIGEQNEKGLEKGESKAYCFQDCTCKPFVGYEYAIVIYATLSSNGRACNRYFPVSKIGVLCNDNLSLICKMDEEHDYFQKLVLPFNVEISNITKHTAHSVFSPINSAYPVTVHGVTSHYRNFSVRALLTRTNNELETAITDSCNNGSITQNNITLSPFLLGSSINYNTIQNAYSNEDSHNNELDMLFHDQVLSFLSQDKTMLFSSPTEGVMIVKVTNVSFSPVIATNTKYYNLSFDITEVMPTTDTNLTKHGALKTTWSPLMVRTYQDALDNNETNQREPCPRNPLAKIIASENLQYNPFQNGITRLTWRIQGTNNQSIQGKQFIINIFRTDISALFGKMDMPLQSMTTTILNSDIDTQITNNETSKEFIFDDVTAPLNRAQRYWIELSLIELKETENGQKKFTISLLDRIFYKVPPITNVDVYYLCSRNAMLKLQYNLTCNEIKTQKNDIITHTLGGEYPFFAKAGKTNYRTLSLSALLSCQLEMDNDPWTGEEIHNYWDSAIKRPDITINVEEKVFQHSLFMKEIFGETHKLKDYAHLSDIDKQFILENYYRQKVFDFLYQDSPLLLRTPTFGNLFIKLQDISFTPRQELGRQIYEFSATAIEVLDAIPENYARYFFELPQSYIIPEGYVSVIAGNTNYSGSGNILQVEPWLESIQLQSTNKTVEEYGGWNLLLRNELNAHNTFVNIRDIINSDVATVIEEQELSLISMPKIDPVWGDTAILHPTTITPEDLPGSTAQRTIKAKQNEYEFVRLYQIPKTPKGG